MTDLQIIGLAEGWIAYWRAPEGSPERDALWWASEQVGDLARRSPGEAWRVILAINVRDSSAEIQEVLSAGPLEDVLAFNCESIIAVVEHEARRNPLFARLLGGA